MENDTKTTTEQQVEEKPIADLEKPKSSWIWIKDTAGYPSVTVTFVTIAFWVTTLGFLLSLVQSVGKVQFRPFDSAASSAYFVPILTLYFGRRWTDANKDKGK